MYSEDTGRSSLARKFAERRDLMNELELRQEFGIDEVEETAVEVVEEKPKTQPHLDTDFEYARENIYQGVEMQAEAMQEALELAKASGHPRAFEVFGQLFKQYTEAQTDLVELHGKVNKIKGSDIHKQTNIQNNVMVGSTADLLKAIKSGAFKDESESIHSEPSNQG